MPVDMIADVMHNGKKEAITFHTWDFAGQDVYYALHHLFITPGLYLVVFNMVEAIESPSTCLRYLAFWFNSIHAHVREKRD
jgi:hypothetical protein